MKDKRRKGLLHLPPLGKFGQRLAVMFLLVSLVPLLAYAMWSLRDLRNVSLRNADREIESIVKMLTLACEAQEALDRIKSQAGDAVDAQSGASPSWQEGDQFLTLRGLIRNVKVGKTGYCYVLDSKGIFQIHPLREKENLFEMETKIPELFAIRDRALVLQTGEVATLRYPWPDDSGRMKRKTAKFGYFKPYDWILVVATFEDEILASFYADLRVLIIVLIATAVAAVLLALSISRYLIRPINQLTQATTAIAQGDFSVKLPVATGDEIGTMAKAFGVMVERLGDARVSLLEWSRTLERKVLERTEELEKAHESVLISEKMASLGKLSAMVAHELNNPLSGVLSYLKLSLKLMARPNSPPETEEKIVQYLELSAGEVKRCGEIVKNLLMFSKSSFGEFKPDRLMPIIDKSIALIKHSAEMKNVNLQKEIAVPGDDRMYCDGSGLQQMLIALMVNAMDAMPNGGELTIWADLGRPDRVTLKVIDTGMGIPESVLPRIFEPFFSFKESKKSIGMGLSVVYGIVQSHQGTVKVESKVGEGTAFVITLPRQKTDDSAAPASAQPPA